MAFSHLICKPKSQITWDENGKTVVRTLQIRASEEADVLAHGDCPQRNDTLAIGAGSDAETLYCTNVRAAQIENSAGDDDDKFLWNVTARYAPLTGSHSAPVVNKARWHVSGQPMTIHINSVEENTDQTRYGPVGSGAEEYGWAVTGINVTSDGAQGVDIEETIEVLTIDFWKDPDDVATFLAAVRALKDRVNSDAFEGPWGTYAAGEAKLIGYDVEQTSGEIATVSVQIGFRENFTGDDALTVYLDSTGAAVNPEKKGWQYLWVQLLKSVDPDDDTDIRPRSVAAYVSTVYREGAFSALGVAESLWT